MEKTIVMELERETKGAVLYKAPGHGEPPACDSVYIRKWAFPTGKFPATITITIKAERVPTLSRAS